jgi:hypothetical protein
MSTAYHPQTDGLTEKANSTLQSMLRACAESREDWDEWLPFVAAAYNSSKHESTGRTPFEMNYPDARSIDPLQWAIGEKRRLGATDKRGVSMPAERTLTEMRVIWDEVRARLVLAQSRQKKYADRKRRDVRYEEGDSVYLSTRNLKAFGGKLIAKWVGPYVVKKRVGEAAVELDLRGELGKTHPVFHVNLLKPYVESQLEWPGRTKHHRPAPELVDGETEWTVERVLAKEVRMEEVKVTKMIEEPVRSAGGRALRKRPARQVTVTERVPVVWYELKWQGWEETTWQRETDCHCPELIEEYELRQQQKEQLSAIGRGEGTTPVMELAVATEMHWWLTDKDTSSRRGKPTVRCSYASAQLDESEADCVSVLQAGVQCVGVRPAATAQA